MKRKKSTQYTKSEEGEGEEEILLFHRHRPLCQLGDMHAGCARSEINAQDTHQQDHGRTHQHEGQLHGRIFFPSTSPDADQQIHRDQRRLIKKEQGEQIQRDEKAEDSGGKQAVPQEKLFGEGCHLPRNKGAGEDDQ